MTCQLIGLHLPLSCSWRSLLLASSLMADVLSAKSVQIKTKKKINTSEAANI